MKSAERWPMYIEIYQLKQLGLNVSQIARKLNISRIRHRFQGALRIILIDGIVTAAATAAGASVCLHLFHSRTVIRIPGAVVEGIRDQIQAT